MRLTDTHCHLDFEIFDPDRAEVLARARAAGVTRILVPGLDLRSSRRALALAGTDPMLHAAIGFHPTELGSFDETALPALGTLAGLPGVVAVGEIGLDYYWVSDPQARAFQREALKRQLAFARSINKPAVLHMREESDAWSGPASADLIAILRDWWDGLLQEEHPLAQRPGVLHSFNGDLETARAALAMNFFIGVTGPVTYKNAGRKREILGEVPIDRLLIETDSPYLTPVPRRGRRNEPAFVCHIADKIGEIHSMSPAEAAGRTTSNAARLFAWGD